MVRRSDHVCHRLLRSVRQDRDCCTLYISMRLLAEDERKCARTPSCLLEGASSGVPPRALRTQEPFQEMRLVSGLQLRQVLLSRTSLQTRRRNALVIRLSLTPVPAATITTAPAIRVFREGRNRSCSCFGRASAERQRNTIVLSAIERVGVARDRGPWNFLRDDTLRSGHALDLGRGRARVLNLHGRQSYWISNSSSPGRAFPHQSHHALVC
jgi:hypothetical protein